MKIYKYLYVLYGAMRYLIFFATFNGVLLADIDTFFRSTVANHPKELDGINIHSTPTTST